MMLLAEPHQMYEFSHPAASLVCKLANESLRRWQQCRDLDARREYARHLRDHQNGRDGALQELDGYEYDIRYLLQRRAAPTKGRPAQHVVIYADGRVSEIDAVLWQQLFDQARDDGRWHYAPRARLVKDDPWYPTKWNCVKLDGNEYGRFLEKDICPDIH